MVENDGMRHNIQRRLRTRTVFVLLIFMAEVWIREAFSSHPNLRRRAVTFDTKQFYRAMAVTNDDRHQRKGNCFKATTCSVAIEIESESEIEISPSNNSTLPIFDYRRLPPISDTTPCEVIQYIDRNGNINTDRDSNHSFPAQEEFYFPSSEELSSLPKGDRGGYHIVREYPIKFGTNNTNPSLSQSANITLQHALVRLDPKNYPTLTRARKACRKGMVLVHRNRKKTQNFRYDSDRDFDFQRGNVGDCVVSGDIIGVQMFLGTYRKKQCYPNIEYSRPQFQLPVLYEDDHLAVVNKPASVAVYSETRKNGSGDKTGNRKTVHFALPFVLTPPKKGTPGGILRRPGIVHRLDKPTSGLLLVAKTKTSMEHLYQQFRERDIQKIYTAIVNGDLMHHQEEYQQHQETGKELQNNEQIWNLIDYPLGGKHALTSWKILQQSQSLNAKDGVLTMVQVRLHTGRYHQIRRHFAWWCRRPLVGDHLYAGMLQAHHFRKKGLFLSSNGISFLHPIQDDGNNGEMRRVEVTIDVPKRFGKLMKAEDSWAKQNSKKEEVPQKETKVE